MFTQPTPNGLSTCSQIPSRDLPIIRILTPPGTVPIDENRKLGPVRTFTDPALTMARGSRAGSDRLVALVSARTPLIQPVPKCHWILSQPVEADPLRMNTCEPRERDPIALASGPGHSRTVTKPCVILAIGGILAVGTPPVLPVWTWGAHAKPIPKGVLTCHPGPSLLTPATGTSC